MLRQLERFQRLVHPVLTLGVLAVRSDCILCNHAIRLLLCDRGEHDLVDLLQDFLVVDEQIEHLVFVSI